MPLCRLRNRVTGQSFNRDGWPVCYNLLRSTRIFSHHYLLAEPCETGNPILSIYQSDMIVYGVDLRHYFLTEFRKLPGIEGEDVQHTQPVSDEEMQKRMEWYRAIPFWGEFL